MAATLWPLRTPRHSTTASGTVETGQTFRSVSSHSSRIVKELYSLPPGRLFLDQWHQRSSVARFAFRLLPNPWLFSVSPCLRGGCCLPMLPTPYPDIPCHPRSSQIGVHFSMVRVAPPPSAVFRSRDLQLPRSPHFPLYTCPGVPFAARPCQARSATLL